MKSQCSKAFRSYKKGENVSVTKVGRCGLTRVCAVDHTLAVRAFSFFFNDPNKAAGAVHASEGRVTLVNKNTVKGEKWVKPTMKMYFPVSNPIWCERKSHM